MSLNVCVEINKRHFNIFQIDFLFTCAMNMTMLNHVYYFVVATRDRT